MTKYRIVTEQLPNGDLWQYSVPVVEDVDYHWGPHPAWGYLTQHVGPKESCSGPDCEDE